MDEKLIVKHLTSFDRKYEPKFLLYDNLPYVRDLDICNWQKPRVSSGNILKFYQYQMGELQIIDNDFEIPQEEPVVVTPDESEVEDLGSLLVNDMSEDGVQPAVFENFAGEEGDFVPDVADQDMMSEQDVNYMDGDFSKEEIPDIA